jgi:hypothetical protein
VSPARDADDRFGREAGSATHGKRSWTATVLTTDRSGGLTLNGLLILGSRPGICE